MTIQFTTTLISLLLSLTIFTSLVSCSTTAANTSQLLNTPTMFSLSSPPLLYLQAYDASNAAVNTGGALFSAEWVSSSASCSNNLQTPYCSVVCAPNQSPHTSNPSCVSVLASLSAAASATSPQWVPTTVTDYNNGSYTLTSLPEKNGFYDLSVGLLTQGGLNGVYYDNIWFQNSPTLSRIDSSLNFQWGTGAITTFGIDYVSIRWSGKLKASYSEQYTLYVYSDDWVRVWFDRQLIIDVWGSTAECCIERWSTVKMTANHMHDIIIEYVELKNNAQFELRWSSLSTPKQVIPSTALYSYAALASSPFTSIYITAGSTSSLSYAYDNGNHAITAPAGTVAGNATTFYVQTVDVYGNLRENSTTSTISFSLYGPDSSPVITSTYLGSGLYSYTYNASQTGPYSLNLTVGGAAIVGMPTLLTITPGPTSPSVSTASGSALTSSVAGSTAYFWIQAQDRLGNNQSSEVDTLYIYGYNTVADVGVIGTALYVSNGLYSVFWTPIISGYYSLSLYINSVQMTNSPYNVSVVPGAIYPPQCTVSPSLSVVSNVDETFVIQTRDTHANAITTGDPYSYSAQLVNTVTNGVISMNSLTGTAGVYTGVYTPTIAGTYLLSITSSGIHVKNSPFTVVIAPGAVVAGSCTASGSGLSNAVSGVTATFSLTTKDFFNNIVPTTTSTVAATLSCGSVTATSTPQGSGVYTVKYLPTLAGSCSLDVLVNGVAIAASPFTVLVKPGVASPSASGTTGSTSLTAGTPETYTLTAVDDAGNSLTVGGTILNFTISDGVTTYSAPVIDYANGAYSATFTPLVAGTNYITYIDMLVPGGLNGDYYSDLSFVNWVSSQVDSTINFDYGWGAPVTGLPADFFSIVWTGKIQPSSSGTHTFYLESYANSGVVLYINNLAVIDSASPTSGSTSRFGSIALTAGVYYFIRIEYRSTTGQSSLKFYWSNPGYITKQIVPSTALFQVAAVQPTPIGTTIDPASSSATTSKISVDSAALSAVATAGVAFTFDITLYDIYNNKQITTSEASAINATSRMITSGTTNFGSVASSGPGVYSVTITPTVAGRSILSVALSGVPFSFSPITYTVAPGTFAPARSVATGIATTGVAGQTYSFEIQTHDANDNLLTTDFTAISSSVWNVTFSYLTNDVTPVITYIGGGKYSFTWSATVAGTYILDIRVGMTAILSNPFSIVIAATSPSAATSQLPFLPATTSAGAQNVLLLELRDAHSNLISVAGNQALVKITNGNGTIIRAQAYDNTNGTVTLKYTCPTAGLYSMTIAIPDSAVSTSVGGRGLTGTYYHNRWLQAPVALQRVDKLINFNWGTSIITPTAASYISAQWNGYILIDYAAPYTFTFTSDDGIRVIIDDILLLDEWSSPSSTSYTFTRSFSTANILHDIQISYRHSTGNAFLTMSWACPACSNGTVPSDKLYPAATQIAQSPLDFTVN